MCLRVLHVIPSLDLRDGGPSVALPLMARSLTAHGVSIDVVATMTEADAAAEGVRFGEPVLRDGFTVRFFKRQTAFYKVSLPLNSWLRSHARDYDLLHIHALFSFVPLAAARAARRAGIPYLMRPLGLLNSWGMENRRRWIKALSFRFFDRPALDQAAAMHYTSDDECNDAARLELKSRAAVIPLGIDMKPFEKLPSPGVFLQKHPVAAGREIILFLSRVNPKKGIHDLLPAFAELHRTRPQALLVIAGEGESAYVDSLKGKCIELGINNEVLWTGMLEGQTKLAAFAAARLFVLPSYSENFGIALLEAMAAGLPCVSTPGVALAREAGDAVALAKLGTDDLRKEMLRLLEDTAAAADLGRRAAKIARENYSLEAMGAGLLKLYKSVASSASSSHV